MQIMITHGGLSRTRVLHISPAQMIVSACMLVVAILLTSGAIYHYFFLKAAREGWPVVSQLVKLVVHDESAQRDKILRENLDAMAQKVGDMQARMIKIEAMGRLLGIMSVFRRDSRSRDSVRVSTSLCSPAAADNSSSAPSSSSNPGLAMGTNGPPAPPPAGWCARPRCTPSTA
jgi:hypothetical protein